MSLHDALAARRAHGHVKLELPELGEGVVAHLWRPSARVFAALGEAETDPSGEFSIRRVVACLGDEAGPAWLGWDARGRLALDPRGLDLIRNLDVETFVKLSRAVGELFAGPSKEEIKGE